MSETLIGHQITVLGIALIFSCWLYMLGGRSEKSLRRVVASFVLACAMNGVSAWVGRWSPWLLLHYPLLAGSFTLGYGAASDDLVPKLVRRSIFCVGVVASGMIYPVVFGGLAWWILPLHLGVGAFSIYLGVKNPIHAAAEEWMVCLLLNTGLIAYPFTVTT